MTEPQNPFAPPAADRGPLAAEAVPLATYVGQDPLQPFQRTVALFEDRVVVSSSTPGVGTISTESLLGTLRPRPNRLWRRGRMGVLSLVLAAPAWLVVFCTLQPSLTPQTSPPTTLLLWLATFAWFMAVSWGAPFLQPFLEAVEFVGRDGRSQFVVQEAFERDPQFQSFVEELRTRIARAPEVRPPGGVRSELAPGGRP